MTGKEIVAYRDGRGWSQAELARRMRVNVRTVKRWEARDGDTGVTMVTLRLAEGDMSPVDVTSDGDTMSPVDVTMSPGKVTFDELVEERLMEVGRRVMAMEERVEAFRQEMLGFLRMMGELNERLGRMNGRVDALEEESEEGSWHPSHIVDGRTVKPVQKGFFPMPPLTKEEQRAMEPPKVNRDAWSQEMPDYENESQERRRGR